MATGEDLDVAEAVFRHQLAAGRGAVVFLALGSSRDDPPPNLLARVAGGSVPVKPVSAANTTERTETRSSSSLVTLPTGPWWRNVLAFFGLGPAPTMTTGAHQQSSVVVRRLTDAETGAVGTLVRVGAIHRSGPDEAEVEVETSGEPLPTVASICRVLRGAGGWTVADSRTRQPG